jgi:quercetin dioxygenase-like cupin family protein
LVTTKFVVAGYSARLYDAMMSPPRKDAFGRTLWKELITDMNNKPNGKSKSVLLSVASIFVIAFTIAALSLSPRPSSVYAGASYATPDKASPLQASPAGNQTAPFSHELPPLDGSHLKATVVEVNYAPGEADKPHSHPCTVIGYVAQGAIRFQVKGGAPEAVYKAGESFYEPPNGVHQVSTNASDKEPARVIALFVCDHETKLSVPPMDGH